MNGHGEKRADVRTRRHLAVRAVMLGGTLALLAGCGGGAQVDDLTGVEVTDAGLSEALEQFAGADGAGPCLTDVLKSTRITSLGEKHLVATAGQPAGEVLAGLREISPADAEILSSAELSEAFTACAVSLEPAAQEETTSAPATTSAPKEAPETEAATEEATEEIPESAPSSAAPASETSAPEPTAVSPEEPSPSAGPRPQGTIALAPNTRISSADQLEPGLVRTFSAFAVDERQEQVMAGAGQCLAELSLNVGFSQESLAYLASGPIIEDGEVSRYLTSEDDRVIWESDEFTEGMVDCTMQAESALGV